MDVWSNGNCGWGLRNPKNPLVVHGVLTTIGIGTGEGCEADGVMNHYSDVSPDGKWAAFSVRQGIGTNANLYIMRLDGTGLKQVADTQNVDEDRPSWSPNGKGLAYGRLGDPNPGSSWDVYAIGVPN